ncbi:MAG TPA: NAD(P)/FAD-dependent oxidoreductase [Burkholderiaceae bacterium]|jgi:glycerol-3-phosphate dehydrogenase
MPRSDASLPTFDVAVIGGGVVGCATVRRFALAGRRAVLVERSADILSGASKGNSALLHTGFDAPSGSLELACMRDGYREFMAIRERLNLPLLRTGAMVVAWSAQEQAQLPAMAAHAAANGVTDVQLLDAAGVARREPRLAKSCGALWVPGEHVIDPWSTPLAYLTQAKAHGAVTQFDTEVEGGRFDGKAWTLGTSQGDLRADLVINCAGLYGDVLESRLLGSSRFEIRPRKGQFVVFDKPAAALISHIVLPVPSEHTKGIVIARTIFGNVLVGPTAEEQPERDRADVDPAALKMLIEQAVRRVPALAGVPVNATYAGLRPASERKEYRVHHDARQHYLALGGIRSTGLTSALGLARHAWALAGDGTVPVDDEPASHAVHWPHMPNLAEHLPRDWEAPDHGEIVCHCEFVTRREIEAALTSAVPARDLGGLKRRTRACMGRCQGFYCSAQVAALTAGRFAQPLAEDRT